ncbi:hypothetical protein TNCV_883001 [Trichonephila clavipes]|nr:hypothetical protein TNCV_883001 [Trichonephila clavipes]
MHKMKSRSIAPWNRRYSKDHFLTIASSGYRTSVENVELSLPFQLNASPNNTSRTAVTVYFRDVTGMKPCPDLSPNQLALRITCGPVKRFPSLKRARLY